jgi:hypothetical protein
VPMLTKLEEKKSSRKPYPCRGRSSRFFLRSCRHTRKRWRCSK